jgi:glycosyltransferase involved in cell wall biosynthesis
MKSADNCGSSSLVNERAGKIMRWWNRGLQPGFGVHFDETKSTSGQRFFDNLRQRLASESVSLRKRPQVVLFNVSASIKAIIMAKLRGQRVLLRIDGLYSDKLSPRFVARFRWPLRLIFSLALRTCRATEFLGFIANLTDENYAAFARILLADRIVYQSSFSQAMHARYFPNKEYDVIINGSIYQAGKGAYINELADEVRLVTIYDEWKPAKRIHELVAFVAWAHEKKSQPIRLTILGYSGKLSECSPEKTKSLIERAPFIQALPRFKNIDGQTRDALFYSDVYITFSYRDPCPNAVVEAMAHGLPVVALASGGIPEIVGDAGVLIPADDFAEGFFSSHRFDCDFPPIDFEKVLDGVLAVWQNATAFRARVAERFSSDLDLDVVANRYASAMRSLIRAGSPNKN